MSLKTRLFNCPICKKKSERGSPDFPFCSDRCRTLDLAHWADGSYSIPSEETPFIPNNEQSDIH